MSEPIEKYMKEAIRQAKKGIGRTSPNPMVGVVIVRNEKIIASGFHKKAGRDHAEVDALSKIDGKAYESDTLYVTLEPCNHYGRTPPCTEAILKSGIKNVVVGMKDSNPEVAGKGGRERGIPRFPSMDAIKAVSSPQTKAPAPSLT